MQCGCGLPGTAPQDGGLPVWLRLTCTGTITAGMAASTPIKNTVDSALCAAAGAATARLPPLSVFVVAPVNIDSGACTMVGGVELSPCRTLLICPGFTTTHTPARLHTRTNPSNTITFITSLPYSM